MSVGEGQTPPAGMQISVIVPMYNAAATIERCLAPLNRMLACGEIGEIIVVDDCSTDRCAEMAATIPGVVLMRTAERGGPGAARNHAAPAARGTHLWFVDSDVIVAPDAARVLARALVDERRGAVFGCYDDAPAAVNFLSQYKNLVHRYYHARASSEASTFWAGCGAVERALFLQLGGFDARRYPYPSIEDIELGYRILAADRKIALSNELQGKHLKEWRFVNLVQTEVFRRAIPWSQLMLERRQMTDDLNVGVGERLRALLTLLWLASIPAWGAQLIPGWVPLLVVGASVVANFEFIRFFAARRGVWFAARAFAWQQFYYLYSSAAFAYASLQHLARGWKANAAPSRTLP